METGPGAYYKCHSYSGFMQPGIQGAQGSSRAGKCWHLFAIIELFACYDPVLKELINHSVKCLSHQIHDEIIYILSQRVKADIITEINKAPFYSIIMDTTQDVSKIDQLSQVYRYRTVVKNDMDVATDKQIKGVSGF